jgi:hypothetical protein
MHGQALSRCIAEQAYQLLKEGGLKPPSQAAGAARVAGWEKIRPVGARGEGFRTGRLIAECNLRLGLIDHIIEIPL